MEENSRRERVSRRVASITPPVRIMEVAINTTSAKLAWSRAFQGREARRGVYPRPTFAQQPLKPYRLHSTRNPALYDCNAIKLSVRFCRLVNNILQQSLFLTSDFLNICENAFYITRGNRDHQFMHKITCGLLPVFVTPFSRLHHPTTLTSSSLSLDIFTIYKTNSRNNDSNSPFQLYYLSYCHQYLPVCSSNRIASLNRLPLNIQNDPWNNHGRR